MAQRLQDEENRAAQQLQEEQNGRNRSNQPLPTAVETNLNAMSSSSRQVERHESQRTKNVSGN